jgi:hypothetical protein
LSFEGNSEHEKIRRRTRRGIFHTGNASLFANALPDLVSGLLRALGVAGADDDGFTGAGPTQGKTRARGSGPAEDGDRARIRQIGVPSFLPR